MNAGNGPEQYSFVTMTQLAQGIQISFDDAGANDLDFQDFTVSAQLGPETMTQPAQGIPISLDDRPGNDIEFHHSTGSGESAPLPAPEAVPEPVTVFGTILGIGALAATRRKKKRGQQRET